MSSQVHTRQSTDVEIEWDVDIDKNNRYNIEYSKENGNGKPQSWKTCKNYTCDSSWQSL